jgi:hypothetical protein
MFAWHLEILDARLTLKDPDRTWPRRHDLRRAADARWPASQ